MLGASVSFAALQYSTQDDVLMITGKAEASDKGPLEAKLDAVSIVVLSNISDGDWELGRDLGRVLERRGVTTVVHGVCSGWVCSMMFLSGKQRMFSGVGRAEGHRLQVPFVEERANWQWNGILVGRISEWLRERTKLSYMDLQNYHKSFTSRPDKLEIDWLIFFRPDAQFSRGNVLLWPYELVVDAKEKGRRFLLVDALPKDDATALGKGIITTEETFSHPLLKVPADAKTMPSATTYAKLEDSIGEKLSSEDKCKEYYEDFLRMDSPRAFVISRAGKCWYADSTSFQPYSQPMNSCRKANSSSDCRYYAVDNAVVFVPFKEAQTAQ